MNLNFSDATKVKINSNNKISAWRKSDEVWWPECLGQHGGTYIRYVLGLSNMYWSQNIVTSCWEY